VHQILADNTARVAKAIREAGTLRVEKNARRAERGSADKNDLCKDVVGLAGLRVHESHAGRAIELFVVNDLTRQAVRPQYQLPGFLRCRERRRLAREVRSG